LWAHGWLLDAANPDPLASLAKRGVKPATAVHHLLGYALDDPHTLVRYLAEHAPDLMPYAQEAGLLLVDRQGRLRTHWNLCGALIFPTIAEGEITDLRARKLGAGAKARSLAGSPRDRGAIYPFGWDDIGEADTVMLTESGEFKTLVPLAAYVHGHLEASAWTSVVRGIADAAGNRRLARPDRGRSQVVDDGDGDHHHVVVAACCFTVSCLCIPLHQILEKASRLWEQGYCVNCGMCFGRMRSESSIGRSSSMGSRSRSLRQ
jgi:hypothetical protein